MTPISTHSSSGGRASAAAMTQEQRQERARKGGKALAASLTPEQRRAIASAGGKARAAMFAARRGG